VPTFNQFRRTIGRIRRRVRPRAAGRPVTGEDVRRAYLSLLGRPPESGEVVAAYVDAGVSLPQLFRTIAASPEFAARWVRVGASPDAGGHAPAVDTSAVSQFEPYPGPGTPGFLTDFLGVRTRVTYVRGLEVLDGRVESPPGSGGLCFHDPVEWNGVLRAVLEASGRMVAVELGAGWGPWVVSAAAAAARRGIRDVRLVGVEGSAKHCEFMRQHFLDNGLDPDEHRLLHGVAAAEDGTVEFPDLDDPANDYGATVAAEDPLLQRVRSASTTAVRAYSLPTLLAPFELVDLIHFDIQGSEADVVRAGRAVLRAKVRRVVIGTHGRAVEQALLEELSSQGWVLEADQACRYTPFGAGLALAVDGCQVWRNPRV
jgi:FkbM family methyltransferase